MPNEWAMLRILKLIAILGDMEAKDAVKNKFPLFECPVGANSFAQGD